MSRNFKAQYWDSYWYDLSFRYVRAVGPEFDRMGHQEPPSKVPNSDLIKLGLDGWAIDFLDECVSELSDLRGTLRLTIYASALRDTLPVMTVDREISGPSPKPLGHAPKF